MNYTYKQLKFNGKLLTDVIFRVEDMASIPFAPDNMDFVEYQKWLSEGNTPLPAEE
jgi:hypothetical protein